VKFEILSLQKKAAKDRFYRGYAKQYKQINILM